MDNKKEILEATKGLYEEIKEPGQAEAFGYKLGKNASPKELIKAIHVLGEAIKINNTEDFDEVFFRAAEALILTSANSMTTEELDRVIALSKIPLDELKKGDELDHIEVLDMQKVMEHIVPIDHVSKKTPQASKYSPGKEIDIPVSEENEIYVQYHMEWLGVEDLAEDENIIIKKEITKEDMAVLNGVYSFFEVSGPGKAFTGNQLHRYLYGKAPNQKQLENINQTIKKLSGWNAKVRFDELKNLNMTDVEIVDRILPIRMITGKRHGKLTTLHQFTSEPTLLQYIKKTKQFTKISTSKRRIDTIKAKQAPVHDFIVERLQAKKGVLGLKNGYNIIKFTTFFEGLGITERRQKETYKKMLLDSLEQLKKTGYIIDFKETRVSVQIKKK